jgi:predicted transcriptional regulator
MDAWSNEELVIAAASVDQAWALEQCSVLVVYHADGRVEVIGPGALPCRRTTRVGPPEHVSTVNDGAVEVE